AERAARAEAEAQRQRLADLIMQAPAPIISLVGPDHTIVLANHHFHQLFGQRPLAGQSVREALPELEGQPYFRFLDDVYRTGETFYGREMSVQLDRTHSGQLELGYFNFINQATRDETGAVTGVLVHAYDVTEQVRARQQIETMNRELEARVAERTAEALAATARQAQVRADFYQVFEKTPASIALLRGPELRFDYLNPAYQQLFPGRALLGRPVAEALPEAAAQGFVAWLETVYRTGETFFGHEAHLVVEQADGQPPRDAYYTFTYQAYREASEIVGISIFAYDVAGQVQAREAQRRHLEDLFEQAPVAFAVLRGPQHIVEMANPAVCAMWGRTPAQVLRQPLLDALPEVRNQGIQELLDGVLATGVPYVNPELQIELVRHGRRETVYFNFIYHPLREADGHIGGITIVASDVSESVTARQASEASAHRLQLLTDSLPVLISYIDPEERYRFANRAYEDWFRRAPADIIGRTAREVVGEKAYPNVAPYLARALAGERVEFDATMPYRPDFTKHIHNTLIPDVRAGRVAGIYALVTDVSDQVEARAQVDLLNQELAAINEELRATNEELGDSNTLLTRTNVDLDTFIYTASHDLREPITNLEGLVQALHEQLPPPAILDPQVPQLLGMMQEAVGRFQLTIAQLTDLAQLQQAQTQPAEAVHVAELVEAVRLDMGPAFAAASAQVTTDVPRGLRVSFAPKHLRSIVYNLLSNAVKYHHPDRPPVVQLRWYRSVDKTVLEVADNGLGLDVMQQGKLFGLFQRLHHHVEGSGIGLYMVKRIVENAGGTITVQSQPLEGSTFAITLPA
ncbi:MAG: PAS domain-containing protein, partial [Hymenobacter sp.]|nr:PAS domain-containing protein [Hymenobacter sp.]